MNVQLKELSRDARAGNVFEHRRDTALRLFAENGFKQVTMRDLAQRVGLKPGSIYHYIESKEQLLFEFLEEVYDALLLPNRRVSTVTATTSSARLQSFVISHIQVYRSIPLHFQLLEKERRSLTGAYDAALTSNAEEYTSILYNILLPLVESEHRATEVASALVGLLNSVPGCLFRTGFAEADVGRIMFELAVETLALVGE
jgi:AcrR family transcriptional regulator